MTVSKTAQYVAFYRALETLEPSREPLFRDPLARSFLGPRLALALTLSELPSLRRLVLSYVDVRSPGARLALSTRTRFIDDQVRGRVAAGMRQVVVLGAGFDCRAHRLPELRDVTVFEVDRAELQEQKRARLARAVMPTAPDLRYVAVDFLRDDIGERLRTSGFDASRPSLFVWEGVANYLPEESVLKVLSFVAQAAKTSVLVFSYVHAGLLDGSLVFPGSDRIRLKVTTSSEPWLSGFHPSSLAARLAALGILLREDLGADEYRRHYLVSEPEARYFSFYRLAVVEV